MAAAMSSPVKAPYTMITTSTWLWRMREMASLTSSGVVSTWGGMVRFIPLSCSRAQAVYSLWRCIGSSLGQRPDSVTISPTFSVLFMALSSIFMLCPQIRTDG